jgi:putative transposase
LIWVLIHEIIRREKPQVIRMDNGPELIATLTQKWIEAHGIPLQYIQPGKPTQDAYIERFNGSLRRAVLDAQIFEDIHQLKDQIDQWTYDYNHYRPHESLNNLPPIKYAEKHLQRVPPEDNPIEVEKYKLALS